ncbi:MAG: 50S ribosomal protein L4 [Candidatus Ancillula trichonymphae]|jgi:large subunit ribosomal protein L4|nr:50S ribosomal protein L4 [Candidatus Ancillula trichonymphae]
MVSTTKDLLPEFFGATPEEVKARIPVIHQVVVAQLAAARQGMHKVKTRGEVSGGGKKPFRQKRTGRARQGSTKAPHMTGGGVVHGPVPRDYSQRTPRKLKTLALKMALSDRNNAGQVFIAQDFGITSDVPSTKSAKSALEGITTAKSVLVLVSRPDDNKTSEARIKSLRNLKNVHLLYVDQLNTYDVLLSDAVIFTQSAYDELLAASAANKDRG